MILDFVHFLHGELLKQGNEEIEIRVLALAALNGRKPQPLVAPTIDLAQVPRTLFHQKEIIVPLTEPLREQAWEVPLLDWEQHPDLPNHRRRGRTLHRCAGWRNSHRNLWGWVSWWDAFP
ncbi:Vitamin K-dependent gamma-carboxylase [Symmachiella macrocystis]|uniref:Vitamin K-dependent gamma-carboxylase n=1 Tax=Symmachiella macrocystis TaxID=2527985 RepID=A0A5C6B9G2_9PLAN|nr:Vitamin K-dependent gamma-carboxylase [Symmachiella macrocystis]